MHQKDSFMGKEIIVFTAHPDDESYAMAGTIFKNHLAGGRNVLICASLGEKGTSHMKKVMSSRQVGLLRKKELKLAAGFLHVSKLFTLNLPDGQVRLHKEKLFQKGLAIVKKLKGDFIFSFGPDGISGHQDHIAVGSVAKKIAKQLKIPFVSFSLPQKMTGSASKWLRSRRKSKHYANRIVFKKPNVCIEINGAIKKKALSFHQSQMDGKNAFTGFPGYAVKELLKAEYFIV
ncbi:hypothetical protein EPO05_00420 [Patescibacteria group bacterium]|nr:MAG: hypothetical protein EPO05_00420 [Patescibacteria group bacterium]